MLRLGVRRGCRVRAESRPHPQRQIKCSPNGAAVRNAASSHRRDERIDAFTIARESLQVRVRIEERCVAWRREPLDQCLDVAIEEPPAAWDERANSARKGAERELPFTAVVACAFEY